MKLPIWKKKFSQQKFAYPIEIRIGQHIYALGWDSTANWSDFRSEYKTLLINQDLYQNTVGVLSKLRFAFTSPKLNAPISLFIA